MDRLKRLKHSKSTPPPTTPKTFHPFTRLPPELRLKIWGLSLPGPRVLHIKYVELKVCHRGGYQKSMTKRHGHNGWGSLSECRGIAMTPALLHVNCEARWFAKQFYQLSFYSFLAGPVWFDWERDTLFLKDNDTAWSFFESVVPVQDIVHLRISLRHLMIGGFRHHENCSRQVQKMKGLKTFTLERPTTRFGTPLPPTQLRAWEQQALTFLYRLWRQAGMKAENVAEVCFLEMKKMKAMAKEDHREMKRRKLIRKGLDSDGLPIKMAMVLHI